MDNFDDLRAALGRMTEGEWQSLPDIDGYCWVCDADRNGVADSVEAADAAGIVALRNHAPAAIAEHAALLERVKVLEAENARLRQCFADLHNQFNIVGSPYDLLLQAVEAVCKDVRRQARSALGGAHGCDM